MSFCRNCGAKLNEGAKFCKECGTSILRIPQKTEKDKTNILKNRKILLLSGALLVLFVIVCSFTLPSLFFGGGNDIKSPPTTTTLSPIEIRDKSFEEFNKVKSYSMYLTIQGGDQNSQTPLSFTAKRDLANKQYYYKGISPDGGSSEFYLLGNDAYSSNTQGVWTKRVASEVDKMATSTFVDTLDHSVPEIIMKNSQVKQINDEFVGDEDCYVIKSLIGPNDMGVILAKFNDLSTGWFDKINNIECSMWISKKTLLPQKIDYSISQKPASYEYVINFMDYNNVDIELPLSVSQQT